VTNRPISSQALSDFIERWQTSGGAERANYQLFLTQLCDILEVAHPAPTRPNDEHNSYVFERAVTFQNPDGTTSPGRIDLYKRGCFVLEAKQGSQKQLSLPPGTTSLFADLDLPPTQKQKKGTALRGTKAWDVAMVRARGQAERYAKALPMSEGWPVFLLIVDIGHSFELYSDFTRAGKTYLPLCPCGSAVIR
jgi:hypothetical protein